MRSFFYLNRMRYIKNTLLTISFLITCSLLNAQKISGYIYSYTNNEPLIGVNVYYKYKDKTTGTISNIDGYYELSMPNNNVYVVFSYIGYDSQQILVNARQGYNLNQNIYLKPQSTLMDEVVVSASRYEQKLCDLTVSMHVLKSNEITNQSAKDLSYILNNLPGVDVTDKQPSIRGGSGWTYGVGSRSMILVDGMSVLTPGNGEINWNTIPMENIEQVEVLKGASSVLYGSSALNGLINVRTARPGLDPQTKINVYGGVYGKPAQDSYAWWSKSYWDGDQHPVRPMMRQYIVQNLDHPIYDGVDVSHTRRINHLDFSLGFNFFNDEGYRLGDYNTRFRVGGNMTYHDPKIQGLNYGLNFNYLWNNYGGFFIWRSPEQAYNPSPMANMGRKGNTFYVDPFASYSDAENNTIHRVKARYYRKKDKIVKSQTGTNPFELLDNMGYDFDKTADLINLIQNPSSLAIKFLPYILKKDYVGLANSALGMLGEYFPTATNPDYIDLISLIMNNTPLPSSQDELLPWLSDINNNQSGMIPSNTTSSAYVDYQFNKSFNTAQITTGLTYEHVQADAEAAGKHRSNNAALFFQYDDKFFERLNISLGVRLEYYSVDSYKKEAKTDIFGVEVPFRPLFRGGINYQLTDYTFLRGSFGQGYRYPSIVEKYVFKNIGGVAAYPNPDLKAESGYSAEIGIKQGYRLGPVQGFVDVAGFYTRYKNMIEFRFGLFNTETYAYIDNLSNMLSMITNGVMPGIGAQFINVADASIMGFDISTNGVCQFNSNATLMYSLGYVFVDPKDKNSDKLNAQEDANDDILAIKSKSNRSDFLKYRQKHSLKGGLDFQWKRLTLGGNFTWKSKVLATDYFLIDERDKTSEDIMDVVRSLIFGDLNTYWKDHNKGYFTMDLRMGVDLTKNIRFQFQVNNVLNKEYSARPMDVAAPRTYIGRFNFNF